MQTFWVEKIVFVKLEIKTVEFSQTFLEKTSKPAHNSQST